jgi:hypothetical protein
MRERRSCKDLQANHFDASLTRRRQTLWRTSLPVLLRAIEVSDLENRLDALEGTQQTQGRAILQSNPPDR